MTLRSRVEAVVSSIVEVHPHEISVLLHSAACFFFLLSAYFVILPLRDDVAISLGLTNLPGLFVGSLVLTLVAAPVSTVVFSLPNIPKKRALFLIHRFFSLSLCGFFFLWYASLPGHLPIISKDMDSHSAFIEEKGAVNGNKDDIVSGGRWNNHGWFYVLVRMGLYLWVALLNLVSISLTWARVIDVMNNESGSRLFGFVGAGATLGQLFGSLFAAVMAWSSPYLLLFSALLMELAARSTKGICIDLHPFTEELVPVRDKTTTFQQDEYNSHASSGSMRSSPKSPAHIRAPQSCVLLDGLWLILSSSYLFFVTMFIWLGAVVSSFFYFQKVTIIATTIANPLSRRRMFAEINGFIAIFILVGQLTMTGRILTIAGVTIAISSAPLVAISNMIILAIWPTWINIVITETLRKLTTYVVARPGKELLFTVVSQDEKYKAKVCIDVIIQRFGDAAAAGIYKLLFGLHNKQTYMISLCVLPVLVLAEFQLFFDGVGKVSVEFQSDLDGVNEISVKTL